MQKWNHVQTREVHGGNGAHWQNKSSQKLRARFLRINTNWSKTKDWTGESIGRENYGL